MNAIKLIGDFNGKIRVFGCRVRKHAQHHAPVAAEGGSQRARSEESHCNGFAYFRKAVKECIKVFSVMIRKLQCLGNTQMRIGNSRNRRKVNADILNAAALFGTGVV